MRSRPDVTACLRSAPFGVAAAVVLFVALATPLRAAELLMFEEPGCPWCERWRREAGAAYPNTSEGRRAPLRRVPLARAREFGTVLAAPIVVSPTFVLVDRGREVGRITGYPGADFFWGLLEGLVARLEPGG